LPKSKQQIIPDIFRFHIHNNEEMRHECVDVKTIAKNASFWLIQMMEL
jgi:hypothetical protein